jgi:SAM-dependent methyltransferase
MNKQYFWDKKILGWENDKYALPQGWFHRVFDANRSLKYRQLIARNILTQVVKGKSVLEIGCGTARLLPSIMEAGAAKYRGVDISPVAIEEAKIRHGHLLARGNVELLPMNVAQIEKGDAEICFSLGLLDWLELIEIREMVSRLNCEYYLHSFSERRPSAQQWLHKLYVYLFYGHRTKTYVPRYYTHQQLIDIFTSFYGSPPAFFRSPLLSFGTFVHHLPGDLIFE